MKEKCREYVIARFNPVLGRVRVVSCIESGLLAGEITHGKNPVY